MKNQQGSVQIDKREVKFLLPKTYDKSLQSYPTVYLLDGDVLLPVLEKMLEGQQPYKFILVGVPAADRLAEYTPWPEKALNARFADFGGKGAQHLEFLQQRVLPHMQNLLGCTCAAQNTALAGHSLGGLLSTYSLFTTQAFGHVASVSGSFWYNGWKEFVNTNSVVNTAASVYLSSGTNEGERAQDIKKNAADATKATFECLAAALPKGSVQMQWNEYKHHENIGAKLLDALAQLDKNLCASALEK